MISDTRPRGRSSIFVSKTRWAASSSATRTASAIRIAAVTTMVVWRSGNTGAISTTSPTSPCTPASELTGSERGTSSRCPRCKHTHKPRGRNWVCRRCGFRGHRDLVGSVNMHQDAFGMHVKCPRSFTYLRPGPLRTGARSSRAGTPLVEHSTCCLDQPPAHPPLAERVSSEAGYPGGDVQKPVPF